LKALYKKGGQRTGTERATADLTTLYRTAESLGVDIVYDTPVTALEILDGMFSSAATTHSGQGAAVDVGSINSCFE
jgi:phytoene dehydrogenase-like protein